MSLREWQEVQEVLRHLAAFYQSGAGEGATLRRGEIELYPARRGLNISIGAGEGDRTLNINLGKVAFCH